MIPSISKNLYPFYLWFWYKNDVLCISKIIFICHYCKIVFLFYCVYTRWKSSLNFLMVELSIKNENVPLHGCRLHLFLSISGATDTHIKRLFSIYFQDHASNCFIFKWFSSKLWNWNTSFIRSSIEYYNIMKYFAKYFFSRCSFIIKNEWKNSLNMPHKNQTTFT